MSIFKKYLELVLETTIYNNDNDLNSARRSILRKLNKTKVVNDIAKENPELKAIVNDEIIDYEKFMKTELPSTLSEFKAESKNLSIKALNYLHKAIEIAIENVIGNKFNKNSDKVMQEKSRTSDMFRSDLSKKIIRSLAADFDSKMKEADSFTTSYRISLDYINSLVSEAIIDISDAQILKFYNRKEIKKLNSNSLWKYITQYFKNNSNIHSFLSKMITKRFIEETDRDLLKSVGSGYFSDFMLDNNKENLKKIKLEIVSEKKMGSVIEFSVQVSVNVDLENAEGRKTRIYRKMSSKTADWLKKSPEERAAIEKRRKDRKISREDSLRSYVGSAKGQLAKQNSGYYGDNKEFHAWKKEVKDRQKKLDNYMKNK